MLFSEEDRDIRSYIESRQSDRIRSVLLLNPLRFKPTYEKSNPNYHYYRTCISK